MPIDEKTDQTFRELVGHSIRNRVDEIQRVIAEAGEKGTGQLLSLVIQSSAYIVINASERWPKNVDLKEAARISSESAARLPISADEIHSYLSRVVFGSEQLNAVFPDAEKSALVPLYTLASLLVAFDPPKESNGKDWNDWVDVIEAAIEAAEQVAPLAAPAVAYRYLRK